MSKKDDVCKDIGENLCLKSSKGILLVDPSGYIVNNSIKHEDLIVYASLVARVKTKSLVIQKEEERSIQINFIKGLEARPGQAPIGTSFLTTNWTQIGSVESQLGTDLETFGMTNIEISFNASFTPKIVIEFVDVRGATLFEQGSCSPYGAFFHQPYPVFELTVKGYYGRPVKYFLALEKFNTSFDPSSGNYKSTGEFIGYSYAFLSDILMGYVFASPYMDGAKEKLVKIYEKYIKYMSDMGFGQGKGADPRNYFFESGKPNTNPVENPTTDQQLVQSSVITVGTETINLPIVITGNYDANGLGGDALHSFDRRKEGFGGYMFHGGLGGDWSIPEKYKSRINVGTQGGTYAGKGANYVMDDLAKKGIRPDIAKIEIDIDWAKYTVSWSIYITQSTDGKVYIGGSTRGSIGSNYAERADEQIPEMKEKNSNFTNWKQVYLIDDSTHSLRQYFFVYTGT